MKLDEFTEAYIATALWSSTDNSDETGGEPLDTNYGPWDIHPDTLSRMIADCASFQESEARHGFSTIDENLGQAGHDFWLTRNGHGAGFWDGDWPKDEGERLTKVSEAYGEFDLIVGDDGFIHG